jgi:hypothetical protein
MIGPVTVLMSVDVEQRLIRKGWPKETAHEQALLLWQGVRDHRIADDTISALEELREATRNYR